MQKQSAVVVFTRPLAEEETLQPLLEVWKALKISVIDPAMSETPPDLRALWASAWEMAQGKDIPIYLCGVGSDCEAVVHFAKEVAVDGVFLVLGSFSPEERNAFAISRESRILPRALVFGGAQDSLFFGASLAALMDGFSLGYYQVLPGEGDVLSQNAQALIFKEITNLICSREVLTVHVKLTHFSTVRTGDAGVNMIAFTGTGEGEGFSGNILPGAADVQRFSSEGCTLCAKYMLSQTDEEGNTKTLYIDNRGAAVSYGAIRTCAQVVTDVDTFRALPSSFDGWIENIFDDEKEDIRIHLYADTRKISL